MAHPAHDDASTRGHSASSLTATAVDLVREVGMEGFTVRELARRAGVFPTTVSHHLGDLEAVRRAVSDAVIAMVEIPPPPTRPDRWRTWLERLALDGYQVIARHPGTYLYIARVGPSCPSQVAIIDATMQVLVAAGLDDHEAALTYGAFIGHIGQSADLAAMMNLHAAERPERRAEFIATVTGVAGLHAGLAAALPTFAEWDHDEAFRYGLDRLLDGIEMRLSAS
ncbi:MAG: TetR/AcrR family transcriptional regulator [Acidimicrobiales bacterium]